MSSKKKTTGGNPAKKSDPIADAVYRRMNSGVLLVKDLQKHIAPMGDSRITLEQWTYLRAGVFADFLLYAHLTGKPSPIDIILASEQAKVNVEM